MARRLFRLSQIFFTRMQLSGGKTLNEGLNEDILWMSLSGKEHQIGLSKAAHLHTGRRSVCGRADDEAVQGGIPLGVYFYAERNTPEIAG